MKKLYSILFAVVVVLCFAPIVRAQDWTIPGVLGFTPVFPNDHGTTTKNGVGFSKSISAPHDGNYWIKLEAYATGEGVQTSTSVPSDIILILDTSSSMTSNNYPSGNGNPTRLAVLKESVIKFLGSIYDDAVKNRGIDSHYAGNRIAIVTYDRNARLEVDWMDVEGEYNGGKALTKNADGTYSGTLVTEVNGIQAHQGTRPDHGIEMAIDLLLDDSPRTDHARNGANLNVVFFTDGYPTDGYGTYHGEQENQQSTDHFDYSFANKTLYYGSLLKQTYNAKVFTIGLLSNVNRPRNPEATNSWQWRNYKRVLTMMDWLSSNYPSAEWEASIDDLVIESLGENGNYYDGHPTGNGQNNFVLTRDEVPDPWKTEWSFTAGNNANEDLVSVAGFNPKEKATGEDVPESGYSFLVSNDMSFDDIFEAISSQSGGAAEASLSESTSTVDIVSSSFTLPPDSDASAIKVFTQPYLFNKTTKQAYWGTETLAPHSDDTYTKKWTDDQGVEHTQENVDVDKDIVVDPDALADNIISISGFDYSNNWCGPIKENGVVVDVHKGYKVIILIPIQMSGTAVGGPGVATNEPGSGIYVKGQDEPIVTFDIPDVSLPVNISIKKTNLSKGESAKFLIQRTTLPITSSSSWEYVTSVFLTNRDGTTDPVVNIKGLPSTKGATQDYVYRIIEEDWGWSYEFSKATGKGYQYTYDDDGNVISATIVDIVVEEREGVTTDLFVINPITFSNTKESNADKVRHAESKVTNTFWGTDGVKRWNDSKNNGRTNN